MISYVVELFDDCNVDVPSWKYLRNLKSPRVSSAGFGNDSKMMVSSVTGETVSKQTVYRHLGHIGLYDRRPVRCVPLTATHCRLRWTWSREHSLWTPQQTSCVMFSNESRFRRALDWFEVLGYRVDKDKATDYAHLKQALSEQFPVVRNRSELETRFYSSSQKHNQKPSNFVYDLLKIHKILKLEMTEEKLIDHIISRLEPQILDYVEVRNPQTTSNLLQIIDIYEERFLKRKIRGSSLESRNIQPNENNRFPNRKIGGKREVAIDMLTTVDHGESSIDLRVKVL
ncbi:transposable element Tcb1 transposase [Trichonephila clavipes]|uniref:Transposable element Tcb1 transposase n=1 Tax=Trichonephila clavipes TaxID=2585209 RepID=A0A8X6RK10_TRICX|nr:transposable element Tcb1 transposase [Trichonephila clavipes]